MLKSERTWETLGIPQGHKISSQSLKGYCTRPAGIALLSGGDAYGFLVRFSIHRIHTFGNERTNGRTNGHVENIYIYISEKVKLLHLVIIGPSHY